MNFATEYMGSGAVCVDTPNGGTQLVLGFVAFPDGVGWMDDGFLEHQPGHPPLHQLKGIMEVDGAALVIEGHRFRPIRDGEEAARVWRQIEATHHVSSIHRHAEHRIKINRLDLT